MSGKTEKALRRAMGISKAASRDEREFEAKVKRLRMQKVADADQPIRSLQPKRRAFAFVGLGLFALAILAAVLGSC